MRCTDRPPESKGDQRNSLEDLRPVRSEDISWERRGMRVILKVPWAKAGIHLKHLKPLNVGDIPVTLKPIVDEIWLSCDGSRSAEQIYEGIRARYPDTTLLTMEYITDKITQLVEKGWLVVP